MAEPHADVHALLDTPATPTGTTRMVTTYRDRDGATWYLLDPTEVICLYCALQRTLHGQTPCVAATVAHVFAPRGLATARHVLDMPQVGETRQVQQRQLRQVYPDGTTHAYWEPLA